MTMANVAWALATNGERVLAIDWDLEAPGLHRYFHPFLADPEQSNALGLIDRVWDYIDTFISNEESKKDRFRFAHCDDIIQPLELPQRSKNFKGCLHFLGAGKQDSRYSEKVGGLDWATFYERFDGEKFINRLISWARERYTHVLIDSRTGVADTAGICTAQIPDSLIICLVYNRQSIEGSAAVARSIRYAREKQNQSKLDIRVIPCRVEERGVVESARRYTASRLATALQEERWQIERSLRRDEIRHYPWCAFEEKLAVFEDVPDERGSLLDTMHELARRLADRKELKIAEIDPEVLTSIWRRAAFDDPRIADLEVLREAPFDTASRQILQWLNEAIDHRDERSDWLMALGEAAMNTASISDDRTSLSIVDFLGTNGLRVANRAYDSDPEQYRTRFALLLQSRATQLQKQSRNEDALLFSNLAAQLFGEDHRPVSRWRNARALERSAELLGALGKPIDAVDKQLQAVEQYSTISWQDMPPGAAVDMARSLRILAEMYVRQNEIERAEYFVDQAVRQVLKKPIFLFPNRHSRDEAEIANVLIARAEIAVLSSARNAESEILRMRLIAKDKLKTSAVLEQFEWRINLVNARLLARRGQVDEALNQLERKRIEEAPPGTDNALIEATSEILLDAGRVNEAADLLIDAMQNEKLSVTDSLTNALRRALTAAGREVELVPILLARISRGDPQSNIKLTELLQQFASAVQLDPTALLRHTAGLPVNEQIRSNEKD